ncbi:helicase [Candidatus Sumerlaeota bacterium]|nr:helicase [Candidatus Sumerlaeota bacterium]
MPRLESFTIKLKTGENGRGDIPSFVFNGIPCQFEQVNGSAQSGEVMEGFFSPRSFTHSFILRGPESGVWDIESTEVTYQVAGQEPYSVKFDGVQLDPSTDLNLWHEPPSEEFDV